MTEVGLARTYDPLIQARRQTKYLRETLGLQMFVGRLGLLLLLLLVLLFAGALISLAYGSIAIVLIVLDVVYGSIAIVLAGLLVYLRRVVRPRLSEEGEAIQSRIRQIEDAP